jgi:hypothetical protein
MSWFGPRWETIDTAPKDGTIIEIESHAGVMPHRSLRRWTLWHGEYRWVGIDGTSALAYGAVLWRPYKGQVENYRDPYSKMDPFNYAVLGFRLWWWQR